MTLALGLLAAAILIGVAGPAYLRAAITPRLRPGLVLAGWVGSVTVMVLAAVASAVLLALPRAAGIDGLIGMANSCVNLVRASGEVVWWHVARLGAATVLVLLAGRVLLVAVRLWRRHRRWSREHLTLLRIVCRREHSVLWLEEPAPVAYSLGGRRGAIVATRGVERLGRPERDAVLAHERAHLSGRHHLLVLGADILATALPFVPLCRRAPAAVRVLVELSADAAAACAHGTGAVRSALLAVSGGGEAPSAALAMSREAVAARLVWLADDRVACRRFGARVQYAAGVTLTAVPAVAAVAAVAGLVLLYCFGVAD